jgi:hypothetical protein
MADISPYLYLFEGIFTLTGTVTSDTDNVYVNATVEVAEDLYPYGRDARQDSRTGLYYPGQVAIPFKVVVPGGTSPYLFCRLPNPPYGAKIIYTNNDSAPNAMTELDPSNVGVFRNADYALSGKYLNDQVRSLRVQQTGGFNGPRVPGDPLHPPEEWSAIWDLGPNGIRRQYEYETWPQNYFYDIDTDTWVLPDPTPLILDAGDWDMRIISRGAYTYLGFFGGVAPGMIFDMNIQWWNGPGYRCGDQAALSVD